MSTNDEDNPFTTIATKVNSALETKHRSSTSSSSNRLDLWQPRDWPHRRGVDEVCLNLHSLPLDDTSPGKRPHPCEKCNKEIEDIHHMVLCWKCKGAFCIQCLMPHAECLEFLTSLESILKDSYGKCPCCQEKLRALALSEQLRKVIEPLSKTQFQYSGLEHSVKREEAASSLNELFDVYHDSVDGSSGTKMESKQGQSLVKEAEQALERARSLRDSGDKKKKKKNNNNSNNKALAIDEYTHAINAINYFASLSKGAGLVLRPHDLLLIAHCERAVLEGNKKLADAIITSYPKASVRSRDNEEAEFTVSRCGFKSLFYPLPACLLVGAPAQLESSRGALLRFDMRAASKEKAFETTEAKEQIRLAGGISDLSVFIKEHPNCDGMDNNYSNLQGIWKGTVSYTKSSSNSTSTTTPSLSMGVGEDKIHLSQFVQFVRVFPTATAASEYTRIIFETKSIGEENAPAVMAQNDRRLAKIVKKKYKSLLLAATKDAQAMNEVVTARPGGKDEGAFDLKQLHVLHGQQSVTSIVAAIGNVSTKILIATGKDDDDDDGSCDKPLCILMARALVFLHQRLESCRVTKTSAKAMDKEEEAPIVHCADLSVCAYCGKDTDEAGKQIALKACTQCQAAKYCNVDCQRNHWATKGPNSHKTLCKMIVKM